MRSPENTERLERLLAGDHAELDELLRALDDALADQDTGAALARLDLFRARLAVHIRAENLFLFPTLLAALEGEAGESGRLTGAPGEARAEIARLRGDHDFFMHELARAVKTVRGLVSASGGDEVRGGLRDVRQLLRAVAERLAAHNRSEEERVYRLPAMILGAAERAALATHVERELRNLPPRFSAPDKIER